MLLFPLNTGSNIVQHAELNWMTRNYLKYYWLEQDYLEKEVQPFFEKKGFLTAEQFFSIVFWKSKRPAKLIRGKLLDEAVEKLTRSIFEVDGNVKEKDDKRLDILLGQHGFGIAMASAVLTTLYPKRFTVYDYRVLEQVNKYIKKKDKKATLIPKIENLTRERQKKVYWEYVQAVKETSDQLSLRDCDRALWAKSWYEGLQAFISK